MSILLKYMTSSKHNDDVTVTQIGNNPVKATSTGSFSWSFVLVYK